MRFEKSNGSDEVGEGEDGGKVRGGGRGSCSRWAAMAVIRVARRAGACDRGIFKVPGGAGSKGTGQMGTGIRTNLSLTSNLSNNKCLVEGSQLGGQTLEQECNEEEENGCEQRGGAG